MLRGHSIFDKYEQVKKHDTSATGDNTEDKSIACSSNDSSDGKKYKQRCNYGVLYGKIDNDKESVYLKKVCESQNDAVDYIHNYVKEYITKKNGIDFYNKVSFSCSITDDFKAGRTDGIYVLKNNNSWSVYKLFTKLSKGYMGTYAEQIVQHLFNLYIAKEGYGYMIIEKDRASFGNIMEELKLKIRE